jgi:MSHA biogenesis protein MshP
MKRMPRPRRGFAAIAAIFLLVVLAALGAYMLTFSNTQQLTSAQDVQGSRAYWAARAGLEWGIGSVMPQPPATAACPTSPMTLPGGAAVFDGGFTVVVTCTRQTFNEAGGNRHIFRLTSVAGTAAAAGRVGFVERSLSATLEK